MIDITGRTVLITGGSRGIGAACALLFSEAGADVGIVYRSNSRAASGVVREIEIRGKTGVALKADVSTMADCRRVVRSFVKTLGRVDILVNSAGIWEHATAREMTDAAWRRTMEINLDGTMNMIRAVLPMMALRKRGIIVNVASTAGQRGEAGHSHYAASKGAVIALTKSLGVELIPLGIRVNCVSPGWVDTDMVSGTLDNRGEFKKIIGAIPRGRVATGMDIAGPVLFLASDLASHIVGANISVNGGSVLA